MFSFVFSKVFILRTVFSVVMLSTFLKLCSMDKICIVMISYILTIGISYEIISILKAENELFSLNPMLIIIIAFAIFFFNTHPALLGLYPEIKIISKAKTLRPIIFTLYSISLILSIISFSREKLAAQLLLLSVSHISPYVASLTCAFSIKNLHFGKFFYAYPALLVIMNDIFAYLVGKSWGKTPLISVSPNKTIEGYFGGFFFTLITGFLLSFLKINGYFLSDKFDKQLTEPVSIDYKLLSFPSIYVHNLLFTFAASFFAPFAGFLGSAIKRVFNKKDFGFLIPGHGGLTDRFDCQLFMVFFTHFYLKSVMYRETNRVKMAYLFHEEKNKTRSL